MISGIMVKKKNLTGHFLEISDEFLNRILFV